LLGFEICQVGAFNQAAEGLEGKNLPSGCEEHLFHVLAAHAKAPPGNTGYYLVILLTKRHGGDAEFAEVLDAGYFATGGAVVFRDFGFDSPRHKKLFVKTADRALTIAHAGY
jgi:hypothetical protein